LEGAAQLRAEVDKLKAEIRILQGSDGQPSAASQRVMLEVLKQVQYTMYVAKVNMSVFLTIDPSNAIGPTCNLWLEKDTALPAWLSFLQADLWAAIDDGLKTHTTRRTHKSVLNLPDRGHLVGDTYGLFSSQLQHALIGKYVYFRTRSHTDVLICRVKDCGYVQMSELTESDLAAEGLPVNLSTAQKKVLLRRMLHSFDADSTYDETSYVFRMSFEKVLKI
jgi:hypothetical protein